MILAAGDPNSLPLWLTIGATPLSVVLALYRGWLRLPQEYAVLSDRVVAAEKAHSDEQAAHKATQEKLDALNQSMREQIVPALVSVTAATSEATRELRRRTAPTNKEPGRGRG